METTDISLILTSAIALAAVIGPIISSVITVRSNERTKKYEIYSPKVYAAVQRFAEAYSQFPRQTAFSKTTELGKINMSNEYIAAYRAFSSSAYEVMSLIPNVDIHNQTFTLLADLDGKSCVNTEHDKKFQKLAETLAIELASEVSPKKQRKACKDKRDSRK